MLKMIIIMKFVTTIWNCIKIWGSTWDSRIHVEEDKKLINFDIIVDFDDDRNKVKEKIYNEIKAEHPEFEYFIIDDYDISD